jgi:putative ABC transport system permease protein
MIKERTFELAILRTYGASNYQLIKVVFYEGIIIVLIAFILGFFMTKLGLYFLTNSTDVINNLKLLQDLEGKELLKIGALVITMVVFSITFAIYPIIKMNISTILTNEK